MQSLRLSAAAAMSVCESMCFPTLRSKIIMPNFTAMEVSITIAETRVNSTSCGVMILSIPLLSSSIPITITSIATTNPDMYSYRACP